MQPTIQWLNDVLDSARETLLSLRGRAERATAEIARSARDGRFSKEFLAEQAATIRADARNAASAYLQERGTIETIKKALATEPQWAPAIYVRRARFASESAGPVVEGLAALRWPLALARMSADDLRVALDDAINAQDLAILGEIAREANYRASLPDSEGSHRSLAHDVQNAIARLDLPAVTRAREILDELAHVSEWINDALASITTGDDRGQRLEGVWRSRKQGATGPWVMHQDGTMTPAAA